MFYVKKNFKNKKDKDPITQTEFFLFQNILEQNIFMNIKLVLKKRLQEATSEIHFEIDKIPNMPCLIIP